MNINIPLLFLASIIPDVDLLIPSLEHRGPTHSIIFSLLIFIPLLITYRKEALPYFVAFTQHSLVGDCVVGRGIQLLWPISSTYYSGLPIEGTRLTSLTNILLEWIFFLTCFAIMFKTKDAWTLFQPHPSNLVLSVPVFTVLLPTFLSFPLRVPLLLVMPHVTYLILFAISILIDFKAILKKPKPKGKPL